MPPNLNRSVAEVTVAGRTYPWRSSPTCKVCTSPERRAIEEALLGGRSYTAIVAELEPSLGLTERNVSEHFKRHLRPLLKDAAVTDLRGSRALERAEVVGPAVEVVKDQLHLARRIVGEVNQGLAEGRLHPEIKDGLAALTLLARFDEGAPEMDHESVLRGFVAYMEALKATLEEYCPDATREALYAFAQRLRADPVMCELLGRGPVDDGGDA